ncbi:MAG: response regulator FixJ [Gammaproteobacteria bacterium]
MPSQSEHTIFVVDDDQAVRESLRWLLESVGHQVQTYPSATAFLNAYEPGRSGCLLLDVRMPGMSGLELQEVLNQRQVDIPVIIITGHGDVPMAVQAMKAGAMEFIEKPFNDQILIDRVQACLDRATARYQRQQARSEILQRASRLTPREREVLDAVVSGKPNKIIADDLSISIKTVEIHRARSMEKMQAGSLAELVSMCIEAGIHEGKP